MEGVGWVGGGWERWREGGKRRGWVSGWVARAGRLPWGATHIVCQDATADLLLALQGIQGSQGAGGRGWRRATAGALQHAPKAARGRRALGVQRPQPGHALLLVSVQRVVQRAGHPEASRQAGPSRVLPHHPAVRAALLLLRWCLLLCITLCCCCWGWCRRRGGQGEAGEGAGQKNSLLIDLSRWEF